MRQRMAVAVEEGRSSDRELWTRLARADEPAFGELFLRHRDAVYNFCFRRTASWSVAEDAVQATFASLWRRALAGTVEELRLDSVRPVLLAMARGECRNANRAAQRRTALVDRVSVQPGQEADNTAAWLDAEATMRLIREAMAVLPRHQREVVELVAWSELSLDEAAAVLGISVGTVKSRLARARARLVGTRSTQLLGEPR